MPTIYFSKKSENYLKKAAEELKVAFGIIIGQKSSDDKYNIIHFAKLSEDEESIHSSQETTPSIETVDVQSLADQWISASKMTPGSFSVIGVFMSNGENDSNDDKQTKNIKKMLTELYRLITNNNSTFDYAEHTKDIEILFLSYSATAAKANFKIFSNSSSGGNLMPADCKILEKLPQWYLFESNYELEDVFPITDNREQVNIENQFNAVLQAVKSNIQNSEIFIQQKNVDDNITLESYLKENNNTKKNDVPVFNASILLTANVSNEFMIKIRPFNGTVRFSGIVSSRVWSHAKNTFKDIKESIRRDILRSLAARIQIYCDGLTDIHSKTVGIVVNEPPRRIYFCNSKSQGIQFSEYIFRGETPSVAVSQAKQILDMDINSDCIFDDLEGLPDDELSSLIEESIETDAKTSAGFEISRTMYMLGISVALLVLLLSVLLNYLFM